MVVARDHHIDFGKVRNDLFINFITGVGKQDESFDTLGLEAVNFSLNALLIIQEFDPVAGAGNVRGGLGDHAQNAITLAVFLQDQTGLDQTRQSRLGRNVQVGDHHRGLQGFGLVSIAADLDRRAAQAVTQLNRAQIELVIAQGGSVQTQVIQDHYPFRALPSVEKYGALKVVARA